MWFRRDLRLADNLAWSAATRADEVFPLFVVDPRLFEQASQPRRALLAAGLRSLDDSLAALGGRLRVEHGDPLEVVTRVVAETGADKVHVSQEITPYGVHRDKAVATYVDWSSHDGLYVHPPGSITTKGGSTYRVFTPFYSTWANRGVPEPEPPRRSDVADQPGSGVPRDEPTPMEVGEAAAERRLESFLARVDHYDKLRDLPAADGTSRLSVDLKYGWLGPRQVLRALHEAPWSAGREAFARQLAWRDFHAHVLASWPEARDEPLRSTMSAIRWRNDATEFDAWKQGVTGYPIVDAGMRQLRGEGLIHNRVRMIVASFLVKDLLVDWRSGERFLRRNLLDGDVAQNVGNWQWVAGTGTDAAPYFRIMNPVTQSRRFDPNGEYIRRWVPELAALSPDEIHAPWKVGPMVLASKGIVLGDTYPAPLVDHALARARALEAYRLEG